MVSATAASSDQKLITAIAAGDTDALAALYDRYAGAVRRQAMRSVRDQDLANEIVQDLFWRLWRHATTLATSGAPVAAWIFTVVRHRCIDVLRHACAHPAVSLDMIVLDGTWQPIDTQHDVAASALTHDQRRMLDLAIYALPAAEQQAIRLVYFDDLTFQETALRLNQPLGTTKSRVHRGLRKLRTLLEPQAP